MAQPRTYRAIGLMSGTSLDGIDAALIETDGERVSRFGTALTLPYDAALRERLRRLLGGRNPVKSAEHDMTLAHAAAVRRLLEMAKLSPGDIDLVGFHGQTIVHRPQERFTWQIGDGALLAAELGIDVVCDFRTADVTAGGEGAPLVPVFHAALAADLAKPVAVLNIGGVANVTYIGANGPDDLLAFDTGPGNALIDDWMLKRAGQPHDTNGAAAARGRADDAIIANFLKHPFFARKPPKSLDRDAFDPAPVERLSTEDGAATLTAFTARAAALASRHFAMPVTRWIVAGGGRHNATLMKMLAEATGVAVGNVDALGWDGDALEAQAFAFLAVRSLRGLPLSLPGTTGVTQPMRGGKHFPRPPKAA
jgi:anhydro-N-acetylmuramic acid kinase